MRQVVILIAAATLAAVFSAALQPRRASVSALTAPRTLRLAEVQRFAAVLWCDARTAEAYARAHVPGAFPLREEQWDELLAQVVAAWRPGIAVIVYCDDTHCGSSERVARRLRRDLNIAEVFVLEGGWNTWQQTPHG